MNEEHLQPSPSRDPVEPGTRDQLRHETITRFVAELAARQYGVISLAQAVAMGMTTSAVQRRVASRAWEVLHRGVYRIRGAPTSFRQDLMAAVLWAGGGSVVSHRAAGMLWRFDGIVAQRPELTVLRPRNPRSDLVTVHRTLLLPDADRTEVAGIPATVAGRTLIDIAGSLDDEELEAAMESGFHQGLYRESFLRWRLGELGGTGRTGSGSASPTP